MIMTPALRKIMEHLIGRCLFQYSIRESQICKQHFRWDIATSVPMTRFDKDIIRSAIEDHTPHCIRIDICYGRLKGGER